MAPKISAEQDKLEVRPVVHVFRNSDGSCDVRRTEEMADGEILRIVAEDHYASITDLPEWIPQELRG